jgi:hypothetical protein
MLQPQSDGLESLTIMNAEIISFEFIGLFEVFRSKRRRQGESVTLEGFASYLRSRYPRVTDATAMMNPEVKDQLNTAFAADIDADSAIEVIAQYQAHAEYLHIKGAIHAENVRLLKYLPQNGEKVEYTFYRAPVLTGQPIEYLLVMGGPLLDYTALIRGTVRRTREAESNYAHASDHDDSGALEVTSDRAEHNDQIEVYFRNVTDRKIVWV